MAWSFVLPPVLSTAAQSAVAGLLAQLFASLRVTPLPPDLLISCEP